MLGRVSMILWHRVRVVLVAVLAVLIPAQRSLAQDDAYIVTPPGFSRPGVPKTASGAMTGCLQITIHDRATARPTACRLNVVGPDGHFYQPTPNQLTPYSLTGEWPKTGKGNRAGKGPIRYMGRFFYSTGDAQVAVPAGSVRVEVWKGFEYQPVSTTIEVAAGETKHVSIQLERTVPMAAFGYYAGDSHLHFPRQTEADERVIFNLLAAEDIRFGSILAYNEPAGPYTGMMDSMDAPQHLSGERVDAAP